MCHQTVSLAARHLEADGIPTVIMGCAKDIVEYCGVPRLVLESAPGARTTVQSPIRWSEDAAWKCDYLDLTKLSPAKIAERKKEFDEVKSIARAKREAS